MGFDFNMMTRQVILNALKQRKCMMGKLHGGAVMQSIIFVLYKLIKNYLY